jgi:hypothetical protein
MKIIDEPLMEDSPPSRQDRSEGGLKSTASAVPVGHASEGESFQDELRRRYTTPFVFSPWQSGGLNEKPETR